jgi:mannose-1-phosphate guanylyltransferase
VSDSIIGWNNKIGRWSRIDGLSVFGEDVEIKDEIFINGVFILPHKSVSATILEKGSIIM